MSHLFIFAFIFIALGDWPKKTLLWFMSENVLPVFSFQSFMVLCLVFKSQATLSLFLCVVWGCPGFTGSQAAVAFPSATCWRTCAFPIVCSCLECRRLTGHRRVGLFLGFCSAPLVHVPALCEDHSDYGSFAVLSEVWKDCASCFVLFPQDCFGSSWSFMVSCRFYNHLF